MYTQANRRIGVTTPLSPDALLLTGFTFREAISELFHGQLALLSKRENIPFDKLVGQKVTITQKLPQGQQRYFSGLCSAFWEGSRDSTFTHYRLEMVPQLWLLTLRKGCRIFQHLSVTDILKQVLQGLDVRYELFGTFRPRDYCVQYRETDFAFASRLMEEEGIFYFFKHTASGHQLVLANTPGSHAAVPEPSQVPYLPGKGIPGVEVRITHWEKGQTLRSGKYTLWDDCFELPHKHLEAEKTIGETIKVGRVTHKLRLAENERLEIFDYPGGYAQRFDGVNSGGGNQPAELTRIFEDNQRTAGLRMQAEAVPSVTLRGAGVCSHLSSGYKFTLSRQGSGDGDYVVTTVRHTVQLAGNYRSGQEEPLHCETQFTCIPAAMPFRPALVTPKPVIAGMQTAFVVGPPGEEVFTDQYGRVKVQFPWDRQGKFNPDSSCWLRVSQLAAGKGFGSVNLPRVGQEVVVAFLHGDPDQPLVVGSVYNAENMPPYKLPDQRAFSGIKHQSHRGVPKNASEIRFQNDLGSELLLVHAETDSLQQTENNHRSQVGKLHRHEVGAFYHVVVGKPVNVNQAVVGIQGAAAGSGAGGGLPVAKKEPDLPFADGPPPSATGSGAGGGNTVEEPPTHSPDGTLVDTYDEGPGLATDVWGNNRTWILKNNLTSIRGNDTYITCGSLDSTIDGDNTTKIHGNDHYSLDGTAYSEIQNDNHTEIHGTDYYKAAFSFSNVYGSELSYSTNKDETTLLHAEIDAVHLEAAGIHIELNLVKMQSEEGFHFKGSPLQCFTFG
jgi:type VI secretion system secreted protein VgrG